MEKKILEARKEKFLKKYKREVLNPVRPLKSCLAELFKSYTYKQFLFMKIS